MRWILAGMSIRHLFLIGYDIQENAIRQHILRSVQHHALRGQKSFYECWLSVGELQTLMGLVRARINQDTDRVVFIRLDGRSQSLQLGQAEPIDNADYFLIA
jgi:CRISPR-associated protein Cas2